MAITATRRIAGRANSRECDELADDRVVPLEQVLLPAAIRDALGQVGLEVRSGRHTGDRELLHDIGGIAVHIAARVNALASAGEVLVSGTVKDLVVGSENKFAPRGGTRSKAYRALPLYTVQST